MSHLTKTETPLVIWLNSVTHMRGDVHDTRQLPNMQKTLLQFTTLV